MTGGAENPEFEEFSNPAGVIGLRRERMCNF